MKPNSPRVLAFTFGSRIGAATCGGLLLLLASPAFAQYGGPAGGGMMPGMPPGGPRPTGTGMDDSREEGPAEAAPDEDEREDENLPLQPLSEASRRRTQVVELDGYFRLRTDWLNQLHLGQGYVYEGEQTTDPIGTPPFPTPLECGLVPGRCDTKTLGSANMRLRLEPTINVTDQVRVMALIDVLDNVIAGSTPDSLQRADRIAPGSGISPDPILSNDQVPPELGQNSLTSSVRARRAWGEVDTEFGTLKFGRMPWHFGRGMFFNNGACPDCDNASAVDRVMLISRLWGHNIALAYDYGAQGYTSQITTVGLADRNAYPLDLSQKDDVYQLTAALTKLDNPERFRLQATRGEVAFNYGTQLVYRNNSGQVRSQNPEDPQPPSDGVLFSPQDLANRDTAGGGEALYVGNVDAIAFIPSVWFKLGWKALTLEFESTAILGKIGNAGALTLDPNDKRLALRQLGWVFASELSLFKNSFFLGLETGGATGDRAEPELGPGNTTYLNHRWRRVQQPVGDDAITDFRFSPDYHVDQILFRRIIGTVTNAVYVKPQLSYWLTLAEQRQIGLTGAIIYSAALSRLGTPGDARNLGIETNVGLTYRNNADRFYAGVVWGVLWPLAGLNRPTNAADPGASLWPVGTQSDAATAQVLRGFLGIQF